MEVSFTFEIAGHIFNHTETFATSAEVQRYARGLAMKVNGKALNAFDMNGDEIPLKLHCPSRKSLLGE